MNKSYASSLLLASCLTLSAAAQAGTTSNDSRFGPLQSGEASTMINGQPNVDPNSPQVSKSRTELHDERALKNAQTRADRNLSTMGSGAVEPPVGTQAPAGNPSVFQGGTPE